MLQEKLIEFLKKYDLDDKTIIVGFSGGYDSMCLLDLFSKVKQLPEYDDLKVIAAHFNHNWRGEEAKREQEVCRLFAASKGFEFYTKTAPYSEKHDENSARLARYDFFDDAVENFDADGVFTAHNKDDNAETVLYRIIKGTGLVGLKGISERRDYFYRPLLTTTRSEIIEYCEKNNLSPNFDSSNSNTKYCRNYIRLNVIPSLEKINSSVKDALTALSEVADNENAIIEEYMSTIKPKVFRHDSINPTEYAKLSAPVKMRVLHEYIRKLELDYDLKKIKEIYNFVEQNIKKRNGSTLSLLAAKWLYADDKTIEIIPKDNDKKNNSEIQPVSIPNIGEYKLDNRTIKLKEYVDKDIFIFPESTANFAYVDLSQIEFPLTLRYRQDGDLITPFGMMGTMKLKKYFNAKGVNRHKRDSVILIAKDNEILWAAGVGISNKISVKKRPTHVIELGGEDF